MTKSTLDKDKAIVVFSGGQDNDLFILCKNILKK